VTPCRAASFETTGTLPDGNMDTLGPNGVLGSDIDRTLNEAVSEQLDAGRGAPLGVDVVLGGGGRGGVFDEAAGCTKVALTDGDVHMGPLSI
jgi:hypothetical protein